MRVASPTLLLLAGALAAAEPTPWTGEVDPGTDVTAVDEHLWTQAASRRRQRLATAPQPIVVIEDADTVSSPATTIPDRLRYVAGVDVIQERHGQYDVGLRGYNGVGNNRVLVLNDGVDLRWDGIGSTQWIGALHPSDVERVEVAKGPSSVTYGANAFAGAILISDREVGERAEVRTVVGAGIDGYVDADATALAPLGERFYLKASAGTSRRDDLPATRGDTSHVSNDRTADSGDADVRAERWGGLAGWRITDDVALEAGYHGVTFDEWEVVDDYDVGSNHTDWDFHTAEARLRTRWGELRHVRQWADYFYSNQKSAYGGSPGFPDFRYAQAGFKDTRDTTRGQLDLTLPDHALTVGGEYQRTTSESNLWAAGGSALDEDTWEQVTTTNRAIFAEDQFAVAPAWILTGGVRVDDHSRVGVNTSPRAAVNFVPSEDEYWLLSVSRGYRLPNFIESYIQEYYFASDPELDAETITAVELGWNRRFPERDLSVGVNGFFNRSQDQIWIRPLPEAQMQANYNAWLGATPPSSIDFTKQPGPFFQFENLDNPATVLGIEAESRLRLGESPFTLWGNGSYTFFRYDHHIVYQSDGITDFAGIFSGTDFEFDEDLGDEVNGPPPWRANLGLDVAVGRLFASAVLRYVDGRTVFSFANNSFSAGEVRTQELDEYIACDLGVGIDCGDGDRTRYAKLSLLDLFDSAHNEWWQASSADLAAAREDQLTSDIGRMAVFELGWLF